MKYFAYGSNMNPERMKGRNINFSSRCFAVLIDYKLVFNKKAIKGNFTYANIIKSKDDAVEGVLYEFPESEFAILDKYEGYPIHYDKIQITISDSDGDKINAITYIAQKDKIAEGLLPKEEYLKHLLAGKDILSKKYFDFLKSIRTTNNIGTD